MSVSASVREKPHTIVVHPLVLLSATDHFYRVARDTQNRRVVGLLLGESFKGRIDITNSFAIVSLGFTLLRFSSHWYTIHTNHAFTYKHTLLNSRLKKMQRIRPFSF
jgi:uncharacterized membrane protein